jgi:hypothetical protein
MAPRAVGHTRAGRRGVVAALVLVVVVAGPARRRRSESFAKTTTTMPSVADGVVNFLAGGQGNSRV